MLAPRFGRLAEVLMIFPPTPKRREGVIDCFDIPHGDARIAE